MIKHFALAATLILSSTATLASSPNDCSAEVKAAALQTFAAQYGLTSAFNMRLLNTINRVSRDFELRDSNMELYSVALKGTEPETEPARFGETYEARLQLLIQVDQDCVVKKLVSISSEFSRGKH